MVDCTAYASLASFSACCCFAALFIILLAEASRAFHSRHKRYFYIFSILAIFSMVSAMMCYQLSLNVVFLLLGISFLSQKKNTEVLSKIAQFSIIITLSFLLYMFCSRFMAEKAGIQLNARGELMSSISEGFQKIIWFTKNILPASLDRLLAIYSGDLFFKDKNLWYYLNYSESLLKFCLFVKVFIVFAIALPLLYSIFIDKRRLQGVMCILCIPGTYAVHLILSENGYHSHYAFALITLLNFYFLNGVILIIEWFFKYVLKRRLTYLRLVFLALTAFIIVVQSLKYEIKFWVLENTIAYSFIKNSVLNGVVSGANQFHVFGVPNHANQPSVYSQFAVKLALREIGKNPENFKVTVSETPFYVATLQKTDFENALANLDMKDRDILKSFYCYTETYGQYHIQSALISKESLPVIQSLLKASKLLPDNNQEICYIDLRWKTSFWK
jgi:hypothetical protein